MARKPIVQRISLDGGKEIEKQLKDLGAAGEKAFKQIDAAARKADLERFGKSLKTFSGDLATVGRRVALGFAAVATAAGAASLAVFNLAKSGADAADAAGKAAQQTGLQIDAYGRLQFAAKMSGVEQEAFVAGMSKFNKTLASAAGGNKAAAKQFADLGVRIRDAGGRLRPAEAIIQDLAEAFARMPDGARKSAASMGLFGKAGAGLIPFLNEGRDGLRALGAEAEKLGIIFTEQEFAIGDQFGDALNSTTTAVAALRAKIGLLFAPALTRAAKGLTDGIVRNRQAVLDMVASYVDKAIPVVEDIIAALSGRDAEVKNSAILVWRDQIIAFAKAAGEAFTSIIFPALRGFKAVLDGAASALNAFFGTDISGSALGIALAVGKMTGAFKLLRSAILLSYEAMLLFRRQPVVAALTLLGIAIAAIAIRMGQGKAATEGHKKALDELAAAVAAAADKTDVYAQGALTRLAEKHLAVARAALADADAQAEQQQAVLDATRASQAASAVGPLEQRLAQDVEPAQQKLTEAFIRRARAQRELAEIEDTLAGKTDAVAASADKLGDSVEKTTGKVEELGRVITVTKFGQAGEPIKQSFEVAADGVATLIDTAKGGLDSLEEESDATNKAIRSNAEETVGVVRRLREELKNTADQAARLSSSTPGHAHGGYIRGPGGPTSDSILSWLSNGEYVIRAAAVRKFGASFFAQLNALQMPKFDGGGFVRGLERSLALPIPRYAGGGPVGALAPAGVSGRPLTLVLDGQSFSGTFSPDNVAEKLARFASGQALRSAGRKPGWYR